MGKVYKFFALFLGTIALLLLLRQTGWLVFTGRQITSIVVNGKPVGEEVLNWRYGSLPSFKSYMADWTGQSNLKTFEISDGKVILESKGANEDPFVSESPSSPASLTPVPTTMTRPSPTP